MTEQSEAMAHAAAAEETDTLEDYRRKSANNRLGLWLFIISDSFVFIGLLVARFNLMPTSRPELDQMLGFWVTAILLASSVYMNRAELDAAAGNQKRFLRHTMITMVLGIAFLLGVVFVQRPQAALHLATSEGVAGSLFYTMTGFHAFHVLTGVIFLFIVWNNGRKGLYTKERHFSVEAAAVYWHFIDVVWVFFYPALYLMGGTVIGG